MSARPNGVRVVNAEGLRDARRSEHHLLRRAREGAAVETPFATRSEPTVQYLFLHVDFIPSAFHSYFAFFPFVKI